MKEAFKTVYSGGTAEIIIKKSRFIANVKPVESEDAAIEFIDAIKKKYWDASHNCSAYIIGTENPIMRCSDDGEPSKTAGKPMLDILINHELTNLVVVVTRYFGGTLLGTGGLVKAYQSAALEGLNQSTIITKQLGLQINITSDYSYIGKLQYLFAEQSIPILKSEYTDLVILTLLVPPTLWEGLSKKITEHTNGSAIFEVFEQVYFSTIHNELQLFT